MVVVVVVVGGGRGEEEVNVCEIDRQTVRYKDTHTNTRRQVNHSKYIHSINSFLPLFSPWTKKVSALWMHLAYLGSTELRLLPRKGGRRPLTAISWCICLQDKGVGEL